MLTETQKTEIHQLYATGHWSERQLARRYNVHIYTVRVVLDPDKIRALSKRYYEANRDKIKTRKKRYRQTNRDKFRDRDKHYWEANRDKIRAQKREYYSKNAPVIIERNRRYYIRNIVAINRRKRKNWRRYLENAMMRDWQTTKAFAEAHPEKMAKCPLYQ